MDFIDWYGWVIITVGTRFILVQSSIEDNGTKNRDSSEKCWEYHKKAKKEDSNGHMLRDRQSQVSCANRLTMPVLRVSKFLIVIWVNNARTCNCYKSPLSLIVLKQSADIKRNRIFPRSQMVIPAPNRKYQKHELPKSERWEIWVNRAWVRWQPLMPPLIAALCRTTPRPLVHNNVCRAKGQCLVTVSWNTDFILVHNFPLTISDSAMLPTANYKENSTNKFFMLWSNFNF